MLWLAEVACRSARKGKSDPFPRSCHQLPIIDRHIHLTATNLYQLLFNIQYRRRHLNCASLDATIAIMSTSISQKTTIGDRLTIWSTIRLSTGECDSLSNRHLDRKRIDPISRQVMTCRCWGLEYTRTIPLMRPSQKRFVPVTGQYVGIGTSSVERGYMIYPCRHVDSAQVYKNEAEVGTAFRASSLRREEVFLSTSSPSRF